MHVHRYNQHRRGFAQHIFQLSTARRGTGATSAATTWEGEERQFGFAKIVRSIFATQEKKMIASTYITHNMLYLNK